MTKSAKPMTYKHSNDSDSYAGVIGDENPKPIYKKIKNALTTNLVKRKINTKRYNPFKKRKIIPSTPYEAQPSIGEMAIDKLYLDVPMPEYELEAALQRAQQLRRDGQLGKGSTKSTFFKHAFVLKLPGGAVVRFHLVPNNPEKGAPMQLVLNPNQMEPGDCDCLIAMFKRLFPFNAREIAALMLIRRIDVCIQLGMAIEDLIIELNGAMSGAKVYVATDRGGKMQTLYMGSTESAHHGVAYDQIASDEYKRRVGEKPSRTRMREDAELVSESRKGRTQLESRRVFKRPVALAQLSEMRTPFSKYRILQLKADGSKWEPGFAGYVDSVRLRGVYGARAHWKAQCGESREVMAQITEFEARLGRMAAPWWKAESYAASLLETLQKSAAWKFVAAMD